MMSMHTRGIVTAVAVSCINACILNLAVLFVIKDLGAVGTQLVAQAKSVLTVMGGMTLFHEAFSPIEVVGFLLVMGGVYTFSEMERRAKEAKQAEQTALETK